MTSLAEVYAQRARKKRFSVASGPWLGVNDANDPGEERLNTLYDAWNVLFRDEEKGAGVYNRPLISSHDSTQRGTGGGAPNRYGNAIHNHTDLDGTVRPFFFIGNKVYRWDGNTAGSLTDVTPVGVTIAPDSASPRVFCVSLAGKLIVTDGVNRPWVGTNLGATPITGTYIDYDGAGNTWTTIGRPAVFGGSVVFIAKSLNGTASRDILLWSAPADPTTGYKQSGYANFWELFQTSTDPLYAIHGTNDALYYFRAGSIGAIPGPTLNVAKAAATQDSVSLTVGTTQAATVVQVDDSIFFLDYSGRPHRLRIGGQPEDLSWQCRRTQSDDVTTRNAFYIANLSWAAWVPELALVVFGLPDVTTVPGNRLLVFSAKSGRYYGQWNVAGISGGGTFLDVGGWLVDNNNHRRFFLLGSDGAYAQGTLGYVYTQQINSASFTGSTTWDDGGGVGAVITTHALGYDDHTEKVFDRITLDVSSGNSADLTWYLVYETPYATSSSYLSALAAYTISAPRGHARAVFGIEGRGRFIRAQAKLAATTSDTYQRAIHAVRVDGASSGTPPEVL